MDTILLHITNFVQPKCCNVIVANFQKNYYQNLKGLFGVGHMFALIDAISNEFTHGQSLKRRGSEPVQFLKTHTPTDI